MKDRNRHNVITFVFVPFTVSQVPSPPLVSFGVPSPVLVTRPGTFISTMFGSFRFTRTVESDTFFHSPFFILVFLLYFLFSFVFSKDSYNYHLVDGECRGTRGHGWEPNGTGFWLLNLRLL